MSDVTALAGVQDDADVFPLGPTLGWSKGYGLIRLAEYAPRHWSVTSRPCDCRGPVAFSHA